MTLQQTVLSAALVMLSSATSATAQIPIQYGDRVSDRLGLTDAAFANDSRYKAFAFVGTQGDEISISLASNDFDANLILVDALGNRITASDDDGGQCNAHITTTLPETATFQILVNTAFPHELGNFELHLANPAARAATAGQPCRSMGMAPAGALTVGDTIQGSLAASDPVWPSDSTLFDAWILDVAPNQTFTIDLRSNDFDASLMLMPARDLNILVQNDDGAGGCDSRIVYTSSEGRPFRIVANSYQRATGAYTLAVTPGSAVIEQRAKCSATPTAPAGLIADPGALDPAGRFIEVGQTYSGALTDADAIWQTDSSHVQAWAIQGRRGETATIDLLSSDFDPFMLLLGPGISESDDDGAGGCNSRLTVTFPENGVYRVIVNHMAGVNTGAFRIRASATPPPVDPNTCGSTGASAAAPEAGGASDFPPAAGGLPIDRLMRGELTNQDYLTDDQTYMQVWEIAGQAGQTAYVELRSTAFDSYMYLLGPGLDEPLSDDDSAGGCDSRVVVTFPQTATYRVVVNTIDVQATGAFTLQMTSQPGQVDGRTCDEVRNR